jgi:hypothetical protein
MVPSLRMRWVTLFVGLALCTGSAVADDQATALTDPQRLPLRVHIARAGNFGLTPDATNTDAHHRDATVTFDDVPLVETRAGRMRIVNDDDSARMLLWIDEKDLAWGIAKKTRIAGKGDVGVWLMPGARVTATGLGAKRHIKTRFNSGLDVELSGVVPADALTRTFANAPDASAFANDETASAIRLEPGGKKLAGFPQGLSVHVVAPGRGGWKLVEHRGRWLEVRGWVHDRDLGGLLGTGGTGGGRGYGMSDTDRVDVNAGACLYAAKDGPIAGVELENLTRYSSANDGTWWTVYVGNAWGLFTVYVRASRVDKGKPTFAPCP